MGEDTSRVVLESESRELFFLLALRVHYIDGRRTSSGTSPRILAATDALVYEVWPLCYDEHDDVVRHRNRYQGIIFALIHGYIRPTYVQPVYFEIKGLYSYYTVYHPVPLVVWGL